VVRRHGSVNRKDKEKNTESNSKSQIRKGLEGSLRFLHTFEILHSSAAFANFACPTNGIQVGATFAYSLRLKPCLWINESKK
jgi:hypothetical protein